MERLRGNLKYSELTEKVIGVFFDVYNELGFGFLESTYSTAMMLALQECGLEVARQVAIPVWFRGKKIGPYFGDLLVEQKVLLELKAGRCLEPAHEAQLLHYLRATEIEIGLLLNFGRSSLEYKRFIDSKKK